MKRWPISNMWLKKPNLTNTGKLTKKDTFFVLLHIRGFIWNRGQTILLYAIECDTLSFSLAVKIPDFGRWMRRAAAKPSTQWVEIISELAFLFLCTCLFTKLLCQRCDMPVFSLVYFFMAQKYVVNSPNWKLANHTFLHCDIGNLFISLFDETKWVED